MIITVQNFSNDKFLDVFQLFQLNFLTFSRREIRETKTKMTDFSLEVGEVEAGVHMVLLSSRDMEYQKHQLLTIGPVMEGL